MGPAPENVYWGEVIQRERETGHNMGGQGAKRRRDRQIGKDKDVRQKTESGSETNKGNRRGVPQARPDGTREVNGVGGWGFESRRGTE